MAAPVIETTATSSTNTAGANHTVTLPSGIQAGDLILILMSIGSTAATLNAHTDYTELLDENSAAGLKILYRWATGSETNPTFVSSASTRDATITLRISGASNPATQAPECGTTATGSSVNPNPPSLDPAGASKDFLFVAFCGSAGEQADDGTYCTGFPANYNLANLAKTCGVAGTNLGGMIAAAARQLTTAGPEDPGTFTVSENNTWRAQTIAIHPAPPPTTTGTAKISLASGNTPSARTGHSIKATARVTSGAGVLRVALYEGASNRISAPGYIEQTLSTSLTEKTFAISEADATNITSYSNLDVWIWGYSAGGGSIVYEVDNLWLEIPAAAGTEETPTPGGATAGGVAPAPKASVVPGGAVAGGVGPSEGGAPVSETPTPGGATASGTAPTVRIATPQGGAVAAGAAPGIGVAIPQGGAPAAGAAPTIRVAVPPGGAVAAGFSPTDGISVSETPGPGGAVAGGAAPTATSAIPQVVSVAQGGLALLWLHGVNNAQGRSPGAGASLTIGGATAGGVAPGIATPSQTGTAKISLASGSTPSVRSSHSIKIRARTTSGSGALRVSLYEGATNRTGGVGYLEQALTNSLADYTLALSDIAAASIGSYSNLDLWVWGFASGGGAIVFEVDQLWLEIPAAGAGSETPSPGGAVAGGFGATATAAGAPGGAAGAGAAPSAAAAVSQGGAVAGGRAPGEQIMGGDTATPGGAVAGGVAPAVSAALTIGGAPASGVGPAPKATSTIGGGVADGVGPTAQADSSRGGAVAGGVGPHESIGNSPLPGGVVAGGNSPNPCASLTIGGAISTGTAPGIRVSVTVGGAVAGGVGPHEPVMQSETPTPGGAVAGGRTPTTAIVPSSRGGALAGGQAVAYAYQIPVPGGAIATGRPPSGVLIAVPAGGALAQGNPAGVPLLLTEGVVVGFLGRTSGTTITSGRNGKIDQVELTRE